MAWEAEVFIRTRILHQDEAEVIELSAPAEVYEKNDDYFIAYEETDKDSGTKTNCRIRLTDDRMAITRSGAINSFMEFAQGKDTVTDYRSPYGILRINIHTDSLQIVKTLEYLEAKAEYNISADKDLISRNQMTFRAEYR